MIQLKSFAKINLGLEIINKRPDGYHNLKTIFQSVDLCDTLELTENNDGEIRLSGDDPAVEWDRTNSVSRAFEAIYKRFNLKQGFNVTVHKQIPAGSGLGGGSSNAAVILLFLGNYFRLNLDAKELMPIAAGIGADVPFFLTGGTTLAEGIGDILTPLDDLPEKTIAIVIPPIKVSTKLIFSSLNLTSMPRTSTIDVFMRTLRFTILENHLEEVTFSRFPEVGRVKTKMKNRTDNVVMMSGSGSAVYAVEPSGDLSGLENSFPGARVFLTRTLNRKEYFNRIGASPSGKASVFGADTRRFESSRPRYLQS